MEIGEEDKLNLFALRNSDQLIPIHHSLMASVSAKQFRDSQLLRGHELVMVKQLDENDYLGAKEKHKADIEKKSSVSTIQLAKKSVTNLQEQYSTKISTKRNTSIKINDGAKDSTIDVEKNLDEDTHRHELASEKPQPAAQTDEIRILNDSQVHFSPELRTFQQANPYQSFEVVEQPHDVYKNMTYSDVIIDGLKQIAEHYGKDDELGRVKIVGKPIRKKSSTPQEFARTQQLYLETKDKRGLERSRLRDKGQQFVKIYPQYMEKAYSAVHAKFLFGQKGGGNQIVKKMLTQYKSKLPERETSQKYFEFDKDGYMQSLPYDRQDFKYGLNR